MIVTIDGPAGAGKSTVARALAERLGFVFLDTGALYRAVTWAALRDRIDLHSESTLAAWLPTLSIEVRDGRTLVGGVDVSPFLRTPEVTRESRAAADSPAVRQRLGEVQRHFAESVRERGLVTEGRDQGSVVFPDAECKFFLHADPHARAQRRYEELRRQGAAATFEDVLRAQTDRDARDAARPIAPMVPAKGAIIVDSTNRAVEEVVNLMERHVRAHPACPPRTS